MHEIGHRAPSPTAKQARPITYVVQPGDTLYKIAFENGLDYRDLAVWNALQEASLIRVGEHLRLIPPRVEVKPAPLPPTATAQPLPASLPATKPVPKPQPGQAVEPTDAESAPPDAWAWPAKGKLLAEFSEIEGRKGIDIGGSAGTPVHAAAAGRVVYAGEGLRGYGKLIIIKHSHTELSAYAHHSRILVREGQSVARGQKIAEMGSSDADRVKLHFEIRRQGQPVDPTKYLPEES